MIDEENGFPPAELFTAGSPECFLQCRHGVDARSDNRENVETVLAQLGQESRFDHGGFARAGCAAHNNKLVSSNLVAQLFDNAIAPVEEFFIGFIKGLKTFVRTSTRNQRKVQSMTRMQKNEFAFVVLAQRKEPRCLTQLLAFLDCRRLDLVADVGVEFRRRNHAIAFLLNFCIGGAGKSFEQRQRKGRMRRAVVRFLYPAIAGCFPLQHIQRLLVVRRRRNHLPGRIHDKAVKAFLVNSLGHQCADGAELARPFERAGEATIQNQQHMPAGKLVQRFVQIFHRNECLHICRIGICRNDVSGWTIIAIGGNAMAGKIEHNAVVLSHALQCLMQKSSNLVSLRIQQRRMNREVLLHGQYFCQSARIIHRRLQRRHFLILVDADDERVMLRERESVAALGEFCLFHDNGFRHVTGRTEHQQAH